MLMEKYGKLSISYPCYPFLTGELTLISLFQKGILRNLGMEWKCRRYLVASACVLSIEHEDTAAK